ncbi:hypothetical protein CSKR_114475 [Clonorchis sinensis]|uniref:Uncharacterized protein n=1 Tax=Clonorchis sinensis TaxID=79923 RepID=A0A419Q2R9_CLOSI|nr:hypothetical protein CSKR_114475 [Clonorchis sinensis]
MIGVGTLGGRTEGLHPTGKEFGGISTLGGKRLLGRRSVLFSEDSRHPDRAGSIGSAAPNGSGGGNTAAASAISATSALSECYGCSKKEVTRNKDEQKNCAGFQNLLEAATW